MQPIINIPIYSDLLKVTPGKYWEEPHTTPFAEKAPLHFYQTDLLADANLSGRARQKKSGLNTAGVC